MKLTKKEKSLISKPIQDLINYMFINKVQTKIVTIKDKNKKALFLKDLKPAIDLNFLSVKINPMDQTKITLSAGLKLQNKFLNPTN